MGVFELLLPQIWSNVVEILTRDSTLANKNILGFEYLWTTDGHKAITFGPALTARFPKIEKIAKIEKIISSVQ